MKTWCAMRPWFNSWASNFANIPQDQTALGSVHEEMVAVDIVFEVRRLATRLYDYSHDRGYTNGCVSVILDASSTMGVTTNITKDGLDQVKKFCELAFESNYFPSEDPEKEVLLAARAEGMHEIMRDFEAGIATPAIATK